MARQSRGVLHGSVHATPLLSEAYHVLREIVIAVAQETRCGVEIQDLNLAERAPGQLLPVFTIDTEDRLPLKTEKTLAKRLEGYGVWTRNRFLGPDGERIAHRIALAYH